MSRAVAGVERSRRSMPIARSMLVLALIAAAAPAQAQTQTQTQLADPTRPPPEARLTVPGAAGAGAGTGADTAATPSGPQLQSVLNGNHGRQVAVIDGQTLRVGDKIDGATLVQVGKDQVVLQHGRTRQVLRLTAAPVTPAKPTTPATPAARRPRAANTAPEN